jgi:hypothetical protein
LQFSMFRGVIFISMIRIWGSSEFGRNLNTKFWPCNTRTLSLQYRLLSRPLLLNPPFHSRFSFDIISENFKLTSFMMKTNPTKASIRTGGRPGKIAPKFAPQRVYAKIISEETRLGSEFNLRKNNRYKLNREFRRTSQASVNR